MMVKKNKTLLVNRDLRAASRWANSACAGASGIAVSAYHRWSKLAPFPCFGFDSIISPADQRV